MITVSSCGVKLQEVLSGLEKSIGHTHALLWLFSTFSHSLLAFFFHLWCNQYNHTPSGKKMVTGVQVITTSLSQSLRLWLCNMCLLSNYVPVLAVCWKGSAKPCMHLYLNCTGNKNSTQSLFRDISRVVVVGVVKKCRSHQKHCRGMGCAVVQQVAKCTLHLSIKVTCSSVWLCCISNQKVVANRTTCSLLTLYLP